MNLLDYFMESEGIRVNINETYGLASVKYNHLGVDWSAPHVLDARGLILDLEGNIAARPYPKFFNYKQLSPYTSLPKEIRDLSEWIGELDYVMDKADGSLVIAYTHNDKLMLSSSGMVHSNYSEEFFKLLDKYPKETSDKLKELGRKYTLNFEYVSPFNQIVIDYQVTKFILHGARVTETGEHVSLDELRQMSNDLGIELIEIYDEIDSLEKLLSVLTQLKDKEGFVVAFKGGHRLKFKTEEYVRLHSIYVPLMSGKLTIQFIKSLVDMVVNETFDDYIATVESMDSEELKVRGRLIIKVTEEVMKEYFHEYLKLADDVERIYIEEKSRKAMAAAINNGGVNQYFGTDCAFLLIDAIEESIDLSDADFFFKNSIKFQEVFYTHLSKALHKAIN